MKRILFSVLFSISTLISFCQIPTMVTGDLYSRGDFNKIPKQMGIIYNKNSWTGTDLTNDFTQGGGVIVSVVSNKLQISGGANTYSQVLQLTPPTCLNNWKIVAKIKVGTINSTSYGFGVGMKSTNGTYGFLSRVGFLTSSPATSQVYGESLVNATPSSAIATSSSASRQVSASTNDYVLLSIEQIGQSNVIISCRNITTGASEVDTTYTYRIAGNIAPSGVHGTGRFSIFSLGGTFTIDSLVVINKELKNAPICILGDSKAYGLGALNTNNCWGNIISKYQNVYYGAGPGDQTSDILSRISEIISMKPAKVLLAIGSNDIRASVSSVTYEANYKSISDQLLAAGIDVYYLLGFWESGINQLTLNGYIISTFPANKIIDTYTPTQIPGSLSTDNVHPSDSGHIRIADAIITSGVVSLSSNSFFVPTNTSGGSGSSLTSTYVAYGSGSNTVTGSSDFTYAPGALVVSLSTNGLVYNQTNNSNSGTSATAADIVVNDLVHSARLGINSSGYTAIGDFISDEAFLTNNNAANGFLIISQAGALKFGAGGIAKQMILNTTGDLGIATTTDSSAWLHIGAGSTTKGPLKLTASALMTTPKNGMIEFDGTSFYGTAGGTRMSFGSGGGGTPGGSTLQLQYNNAGAFGGMAGTSWDNTNQVLTITTASTGTDGLTIAGSNAGRTGVHVAPTGSLGYAAVLVENNRGSFANMVNTASVSSSSTIFNGFFGVTTAHDWNFIYSGGANNLGFAIGTNGSTPFLFGTNNTEAGRINTSQHWLLGNTTTDNGLLTAAGVIAPEATGTRDLGTTSFSWRNLYINHVVTGTTGGTWSAGSIGSGGTNASTGGDLSGIIDFTTGTGPSANATMMTVTFGSSFAFPTGCRVVITPANANAAALSGATQVFIGSTATTNWTMKSGSSALAASTQYQWYYQVYGY